MLEAFERLQEDAAIADGKVASLNQPESEITSEVGMLEVGLVVRSGGEEDNARIVACRGRKAQQGVTKGTEKRSEPLDLELAEQVRKGLRHNDAVLERITRAGGCLRAVGNYPPFAIRATRKVHR